MENKILQVLNNIIYIIFYNYYNNNYYYIIFLLKFKTKILTKNTIR